MHQIVNVSAESLVPFVRDSVEREVSSIPMGGWDSGSGSFLRARRLVASHPGFVLSPSRRGPRALSRFGIYLRRLDLNDSSFAATFIAWENSVRARGT